MRISLSQVIRNACPWMPSGRRRDPRLPSRSADLLCGRWRPIGKVRLLPNIKPTVSFKFWEAGNVTLTSIPCRAWQSIQWQNLVPRGFFRLNQYLTRPQWQCAVYSLWKSFSSFTVRYGGLFFQSSSCFVGISSRCPPPVPTSGLFWSSCLLGIVWNDWVEGDCVWCSLHN